MARSTRRWRGVAVAAIVLSGAIGFAGEAGAIAAPSEVRAQVAPVEDGSPDAAAEATSTGGSTVESVTTTETRLRRVVIGLVAVAAVTAVLTLGYARHTSPRRRARIAAEREAARVRRLAAAAAVGDLGSGVAAEPERPGEDAEPVVERRVSPPIDAPARRRRPRPDPRPQPRRST
jgi:hypothetical protein